MSPAAVWSHTWEIRLPVPTGLWKELARYINMLCREAARHPDRGLLNFQASGDRIWINGRPLISHPKPHGFGLARTAAIAPEMWPELAQIPAAHRGSNQHVQSGGLPHDKLFMAALLIARRCLQDSIQISSHGTLAHWQAALPYLSEQWPAHNWSKEMSAISLRRAAKAKRGMGHEAAKAHKQTEVS